MDVKYISPFVDAVAKVMPEIGFQNIRRGRLTVGEDNKINSLGVMVVVGITHEIKGNIAYNFTLEAAKKITSTMMMGMPVENFDQMAESALAELGNMLTARAAIIFEQNNIKIDISPPNVIVGQNCTSMVSAKRIVVEMFADDIPMAVNIAIVI